MKPSIHLKPGWRILAMMAMWLLPWTNDVGAATNQIALGKDAFHRVPDFSGEPTDAVERVPTTVTATYAVAGGVHGVTRPAKTYIVTLRAEADQDGCANEHQIRRGRSFRHALNGFVADLDDSVVARLKQDQRVLAVEPDGQIVPCAQIVPAGIIRMGLTNFPMTRLTGTDQRINVDVAVMDTGIQTNHPDLNVTHWVDVTGDGYDGDDWYGHGTHVAGIIGALDNDIGVVGVAPGVRLWSVQVIGPSHHTWSVFIAGCDYIIAHADRISVVNASLEGAPDETAPVTAIYQAVSNVVSQGIVFVVAAGNGRSDIAGSDLTYGTDDDTLPAAVAQAMAVSAMNPTNDVISFFSDFSFIPKACPVVSPGLGLDVAAPGENILSLWLNGTNRTLNGTSMACAHVSGLVALYIAANGRAHNLQDTYAIRQAIIDRSQSQSQWSVTNSDPDGNPEPLAFPSESWVPKPDIQSANMTSRGFQLRFATVPGYAYTIQFVDTLTSSNLWTELSSTNGTGSLTTVTVTDSISNNPSRFYRLARHPAP